MKTTSQPGRLEGTAAAATNAPQPLRFPQTCIAWGWHTPRPPSPTGGTAATAPERMSPLSLSAASVDSTAATTLPGPFLEFLMCQRVSAYSASSLASSRSIFFATWSHRSPGSLRKNRCLKRRPGGSPGGRHTISVLMSCVGACPHSSGANTILLSCSWTFGENLWISSAFSASYGWAGHPPCTGCHAAG